MQNFMQLSAESQKAILMKAHWKIANNYTLNAIEEDAIQAEAIGQINFGGRPPKKNSTAIKTDVAVIFFSKANDWAAQKIAEKKSEWKKSPKIAYFKIGDKPPPPSEEILQRTEKWLEESIAEANLAAEQESAASQAIFDLGW